jgi:hypothetical protein
MMLVADWVGAPVAAEAEALPPPIAWRTREMMSAVMKMMKYYEANRVSR